MTGMKEGAGEDPFADDDDGTEEREQPSSEITTEDERSPSSERNSQDGGSARSNPRQRDRQRLQIPYKFRRDGVQDGRDRVPLFLQSDTKRAEREALRELEERFDTNVTLTDLREALMKVGLEHLDETEAQLEEWGYGMTFED